VRVGDSLGFEQACKQPHGPTVTHSGRRVIPADGQLRYMLAGMRRVRLAVMRGAGPAAMLEVTARVPAADGPGRRGKESLWQGYTAVIPAQWWR
jgi:hypothetical protein